MLRKMFSYGGMLLLAGTAILVMPNSGWAHGGGHGGGGHFGGVHVGGAHFGGYHGGVYHGGFHYGHPHAYYNHYGYYHHYYPHYGYQYHHYYPYYGFYYPYYYNLGYFGAYGATPSYTDDFTIVTPPATSNQSFYADATAEPDTSAHITVNVPEGARLWFEGKLTTSTGPIRYFHSPPLTPGSQYHYKVRASWNENGHEVTQTQQVKVTSGAHINVDFPLPPKSAGQATAVKKG
jgi:uncharacterized protein (TIGR03000 family)